MMKFRKCTNGPIHRVLIAGVALIYAVLLVVSTGCAFVHADQVSSHHPHHSEEGSSNQNALCAWACQATMDAVAAVGSPMDFKELVVGPADLAPGRLVLSASTSLIRTRAPPSILLV